jgi:hypothetical protein
MTTHRDRRIEERIYRLRSMELDFRRLSHFLGEELYEAHLEKSAPLPSADTGIQARIHELEAEVELLEGEVEREQQTTAALRVEAARYAASADADAAENELLRLAVDSTHACAVCPERTDNPQLRARIAELERSLSAAPARTDMLERFEKIGLETVRDHHTGLEWQASTSGPMTWREAMDYASSLGDGWRLPTIEALISLVVFACSDPATGFPDHPSALFWSSTSWSASKACGVSFYSGCLLNFDKDAHNCVRCVRNQKGQQ